MNKIVVAIIFFLLVPSQISASPALCATYTNANDCEARTGKGCEWVTDKCLYSQSNIEQPIEQGKISESFSELDPLGNKFETPTDIINTALPFLLTGAGLILFSMLIWGGFTMLTAVSDPKKAEAGKARITAAIIGFLIIFGSYWITQILEIILGVKILN